MLEKSILLQDKILNYISGEIRLKGYPPTIREIANHLQIKSASTVHLHLCSLEKRGLIRRNPSKPRAIELVSNSEFSEFVKTHPVVWKKNSEMWDAAQYNAYMELPEFLCGFEKHFLFTMGSNALYSIGIHQYDILVVHEQNTASQDGLYLILENDNILPVLLKGSEKHSFFYDDVHTVRFDQCTVIGKVLSMLRKY